GLSGRRTRYRLRDLSPVLRGDRGSRGRHRHGVGAAAGPPPADADANVIGPFAQSFDDGLGDTLLQRSEEMELNFGPQHPATHGVLRLKLKVDGERIIDCYPIIGYLHRGTEKLFELHPFFQNVPHTDRMDYVAAATNNLAYVGAVEQLVGLGGAAPARYMH